MERNNSSLSAQHEQQQSQHNTNNSSLSAQQEQQQSVSTTGCHCNRTTHHALSCPTTTGISSTPLRKIKQKPQNTFTCRQACVRALHWTDTHTHKSSTLYGCETWPLTLREPNTMAATEHGVNKILGRKRPVQEDNGGKCPKQVPLQFVTSDWQCQVTNKTWRK